MSTKNTILLLAVALTTNAKLSGAVINADNHPLIAGDVHTDAVLDTDTNRLWLDAHETGGFSYNQMAGMLGPGQEFAGWQLPELSDVQQLMLNTGIPYPTSAPGATSGGLPGFNQAISDFIDIFVDSPNTTSNGDQVELWIEWSGVEVVADFILTDGEYGLMQQPKHRAKVHISPPGVDRSDSVFGSVGVFLYQDVPEPSTVMLLALGAIGLVGSRGRRRRRS